MSLLGKLLLFFNMLAAVGLIFVATQDWAKRQEITGTVVQYYLALGGIPLDASGGSETEIPLPIETSGGQQVETVGPSLLKAYFKGADGGQLLGTPELVPTQLKEVERVKGKVSAQLAANQDAADKLAVLCGKFNGSDRSYTPGYLHRMAESFEEREAIRRLSEAPADKVADTVKTAEAILTRKFDTVLAKPDPKLATEYAERLKAAAEKLRDPANQRQGVEEKYLRALTDKDPAAIAAAKADVDKADAALAAARDDFEKVLADPSPAAARDETDRRRRIAHLLMHLQRSADWQKRVALVVGLKVYRSAVADQATRLQDIARSVRRQVESDQASFVDQYEQLRVMALDRARLADDQAKILATLKAQAAKDTEALNRRAAELKSRQDALAQVRADVAKQLDLQAEVERQLLDVQKRVGETLDANFQLEDQLDKAEQGKGFKVRDEKVKD